MEDKVVVTELVIGVVREEPCLCVCLTFSSINIGMDIFDVTDGPVFCRFFYTRAGVGGIYLAEGFRFAAAFYIKSEF